MFFKYSSAWDSHQMKIYPKISLESTKNIEDNFSDFVIFIDEIENTQTI